MKGEDAPWLGCVGVTVPVTVAGVPGVPGVPVDFPKTALGPHHAGHI